MAEQNEEKQKKGKSKRLVSKRQYVQVIAKKITTYLLSGLLFGVGAFAFKVTAALLFDAGKAHVDMDLNFYGAALILVSIVGGLGYAIINFAGKLYREGKAIEPVQPITRHNTGHLPAEESLVRAASIPLQAQEAVLLRPTVAGDETSKEELLRAGMDR